MHAATCSEPPSRRQGRRGLLRHSAHWREWPHLLRDAATAACGQRWRCVGSCETGPLFLRRHVRDASDEPGGRARHDAARFHIPRDHGSGGHDGVLADGDAGQDDGPRADPDVPADDDGSWATARTLFRQETMIDGGQHDPVTDQRTVAERDAALILEAAAGIDEDIFSDGDVFAEVAVEGREEGKTAVDGLACEFRHEFADPLRRMIGRIQLSRDAHGVIAALQQQIMLRRTGRYAFSLIEMLDELFRIHDVLPRVIYYFMAAGEAVSVLRPVPNALTAGGP